MLVRSNSIQVKKAQRKGAKPKRTWVEAIKMIQYIYIYIYILKGEQGLDKGEQKKRAHEANPK